MQCIGTHYGDAFAVILQDEYLVPRVLALAIERRQKHTAARLSIAPVSWTIAPTRSGPVMVRTGTGRKLMFADGSDAFRIDLGDGAVLHAIRCRLHDKIEARRNGILEDARYSAIHPAQALARRAKQSSLIRKDISRSRKQFRSLCTET